MSTGKWQKEIPAKDGRYWVATCDGLSAGLATVARHNGKILIAGHTPEIEWRGWWWSEPVTEPTPPPPDVWDLARTFAWGRYNRNIGEYLPEPPKEEPASETKTCTVPPEGWTCSRAAGHEGPCAASPTPGEPSDLRGVMDAAASCRTCLGSVFCDSHRAMYDRVAATSARRARRVPRDRSEHG